MHPTTSWNTPWSQNVAFALVSVLALVLTATPVFAKKCSIDSVKVGDACIDTYEASAWELVDAGDKGTIKRIQKGKIKDAVELTGKATQRGTASDDYGSGCPDDGNGCTNLYAVSIPGVIPATRITWFQATAACRNAGKRLATNQEWQAAALGTPDTGGTDNGMTTCNTDNLGPKAVATGARVACVSDIGAFDMVGNVWEWVADWVPRSTGCTGSWSGSDDFQCLVGAGVAGEPGALVRGGDYGSGALAGPFAVDGFIEPSTGLFGSIGFRCARDL